MTLGEASERFCISIETLNYYEEKGLIRILRKQRNRLLEEIHCKQQSLDELDYMIDKIKKGGLKI